MKILLYLSIFSFLFGPLYADEQENIVKHVEREYAQGKYQKFLKSLDEEYARAGKAGLVRNLYDYLKKKNKLGFLANAKDEKTRAIYKNWHDELGNLAKQREEKLKQICVDQTGLDICLLITRVVSFSLDPKEEEAFRYLEILHYYLPDNNKSTPENKLAAIEMEYHMKKLLLDAVSLGKKEKQDLHEKRIVLALEKLNKMVDVAKSFGGKWDEMISIAKNSFGKFYGHQIDLDHLQELAEEKIQPANETEQKAKEIMGDFLEKRKTLNEKYLSLIQSN
ncbi:MAG: hypothetical protein L0207_05390 [Chlamydiae bacterium]|nr:hypothetical protein [Chlamydiota bacterium]